MKRASLLKYVSRSLCAFPPLLVLSFYATWAAGRQALGHWPRSSLDDPKNIQGVFMWQYDVTLVLVFIGMPLFCAALMVSGLLCLAQKPEGWKQRLGEVGMALALFIGFLLFARWDPQSVVEWYFD